MASGGGRGSNSPNLSWEKLEELASEETEENAYEVETERLLQDALKDFNARDVKTIHTHLDVIREALSKELEGSIDLLFGGSTKKYTYINGLSDVDMLACLNETNLQNKSPSEVLDYFKTRLEKRLPRTKVEVGNLAVTVKFSDGHEIQILPTVKTATGFRIPTGQKNQWSNIVRPQSFAEKLTRINKSNAGKVVPVIKLAKAMNNSLPKPSRLSGYHIESLAVEAFKNYSGRQTYKNMLQHFWKFSQNRVKSPITDSTGQSIHVDDYLGRSDSESRIRASQNIGKLVSKMDAANGRRDVGKWEQILEL